MTLKKLIIVANTIEKKLNKFADVANTDTLANIVNAVSSKFSDTLKLYMSAHMKKHNISELQCRFFLNMKFSNKKCVDCKVTIAPSGPLNNNNDFKDSFSTLVSPLEPNIKATVDNVNLRERLPVENDYPVVKLFEHTFYATKSTTASNAVSKLQSVANKIERNLNLNKFAAVAGTTINDSLNYGLQGIAKVTIEDMKIEENALKIIQTPSSKKIEGYFKTSEDRPLKVIAKKENGKWKMIRGGVVIDVAFNDEQLNTKLKTLVGKLNSVLSNKFLELINKVSAQDNWDASIDEVSFETNVAPQSLIDLSV